MPAQRKEQPGLFERMSEEEWAADATQFAHAMEKLVERIGLLHWVMDTLVVHEFSTGESNEWIWNFSELAVEVIYRDAKNASAIVSRGEMRLRKASSFDTLEAMKAVQRAELPASGLTPAEIEKRVQATTSLVEAEMERWRNRNVEPVREVAW